MKRAFLQRVKQIPSRTVDSDALDSSLLNSDALAKLSAGVESAKQAIPESSKARTSAAMIGLAISMGACSVLLPRQNDQAMAAEPASAEPTVTTAAIPSEPSELEVAVLSPTTEVEPAIPAISPEAPVVEHTVQQGQTLWQLARLYQADRNQIASTNGLPLDAGLKVGQVLRIPSALGTANAPSTPVSRASVVASLPNTVDAPLKTKQDIALDRLKQKRDQLQSSLAELKSEESEKLNNLSTSTEPFGQPQVVDSITKEVEQASVKTAVLNVPAAIAEPEAVAAANSVLYKVNQGDTLDGIARNYGVSRVDLLKANQLTNPNQIQAEQVLKIPQVKSASANQVVTTAPAFNPQGSSVIVASNGNLPPQETVAASPTKQPAPQKLEAAEPTTPSIAYYPPVAPAIGTEASVEVPSTPVYKVSPGDTLDAIARNHGISRAELVKANQLNNPNLITVNQLLKIPQAQAASSASVAVTLDTPVVTVASNGPLPVAVPASVKNAQKLGMGGGDTKVATKPLGVAPFSKQESNQVPEFNPNRQYTPYVERLKGEIVQLREKYQGKPANKVDNALVNPRVASVLRKSAPAVSKTVVPARQMNPEFSGSQYTGALQAEIQTLQDKQQVEKPQALETASVSTKALPQKQQLVATAPLGSDVYEPLVQSSVGKMVSPDLPPLASADVYLPNNAANFKGYIWPAKGVLTSPYGQRWGRMHRGIDVAAAVGTPIVAAAEGVVVTAGWNDGGYGNLVEIKHPDGTLTLYGHNNRVLVRPGQQVTQGQQIAEMGSTGYSTGPHCHFEVHPSGRGAVNPIAYLPKTAS